LKNVGDRIIAQAVRILGIVLIANETIRRRIVAIYAAAKGGRPQLAVRSFMP
jgi:hypothetical protein